MNDVSVNNQLISKRQIKTAEQANVFSKLGYSSVKYFRWIVQIQKIVDCHVAVQYIDTAHKIWEKKLRL